MQQTPLEQFIVEMPEIGEGQICITPCPGKRERSLGMDLDQLSAWGAQAVVTLIEGEELELLEVSDMQSQVESRGLQWFHCPIVDFSPPGLPFEQAWGDGGAGKLVREMLRGGGKVVVHCRGGIGRAGTISTRLLVELGVAEPAEALRRVRSARPGAVETAEQEQAVMASRAVVDEVGVVEEC